MTQCNKAYHIRSWILGVLCAEHGQDGMSAQNHFAIPNTRQLSRTIARLIRASPVTIALWKVKRLPIIDHLITNQSTNPPTLWSYGTEPTRFEVLSKTTRKFDQTSKRLSCRTVPTLQEYALIEQDKGEIQVFSRNQNWQSSYYYQVNNEDVLAFSEQKTVIR